MPDDATPRTLRIQFTLKANQVFPEKNGCSQARLSHLFFNLCAAPGKTIFALSTEDLSKSNNLVTNLISRVKYIGHGDGFGTAP